MNNKVVNLINYISLKLARFIYIAGLDFHALVMLPFRYSGMLVGVAVAVSSTKNNGVSA